MAQALPWPVNDIADWMPLWQAAGFFFATFILEDVATVGAGLLLAGHRAVAGPIRRRAAVGLAGRFQTRRVGDSCVAGDCLGRAASVANRLPQDGFQTAVRVVRSLAALGILACVDVLSASRNLL